MTEKELNIERQVHPMSMENWDKKIGPRLQDLKWAGDHIAREARIIQGAIKDLPVRPAWETLARESLNDAERELRVALAVVQTAQQFYDSAPILVAAE